MPLPRSIALAIVAGLLTAVVPNGAIAAPPQAPPPFGPDNPAPSSTPRAAERALEAVQAAFQRGDGQNPRPAGVGDRGGEITQQLLQLRLGLDELSPDDRELAEAFLARPTDGTEFYGANYGRRARPTSDCAKAPTPGSEICVHYARRTKDAPPDNDSDGDGLPNQVEKTRDIVNHVWDRVVDDGGYKAPLGDGTKGGDSRLDVYLVDIGWEGLYGYCGPEYSRQGRAAAAYCVLDDDYAKDQYPQSSPLGNLQVTAAHEFFHAVQFAYDAFEDGWLMETTATWLEDEIYDDVNDNRFFLPASALRAPRRALDSPAGSFVYGNWIWWRYLTERFATAGNSGLPVLVRRTWELADGDGGTWSMKAVDRALAEKGEELEDLFADFSLANRTPRDSYLEGSEEGAARAYRKAPMSARHRLDQTRQSVGEKRPGLAHLSSTTVGFVPESGFAANDWVLKVRVDLPRRKQAPSAVLSVLRTDGTRVEHAISLNRKGNGSFPVEFSSSTVRRVELTLVNGNHTYDCNEGTQWSCRGIPSPKRPFAYRAQTYRNVY